MHMPFSSFTLMVDARIKHLYAASSLARHQLEPRDTCFAAGVAAPVTWSTPLRLPMRIQNVCLRGTCYQLPGSFWAVADLF